MRKTQKGAICLMAGLILIRGFAGGGINLTSSLFFAPVAQDLGIGVGTLSLYFSIMSLVAVVWLPIAGKLTERYDARLLAVAGALLQGIPFAAFGLQSNVWGWYLLSVPHAMGTGLLVNLLGPILINRYFIRNTGLMLGLQSAFSGAFAAVFQPLTSGIIEKAGWRTGYVVVGLVCTCASIIAALTLLGNRPAESDAQGPARDAGGEIQVPEKTAVRSPSFYALLIFMTAVTGAAVFLQHVPTYGGLQGFSLGQVGLAMSLSSLGSGLGAIGIGIVSDRMGAIKTCFLILTLWVLGMLAFLFCAGNLAVFSIGAFLNGVAVSGVGVIVAILTRLFYGSRDYGKIFAKVSMGSPLASIVLIPAYGFVYDATGSYFWVLIFLLALLGIAIGSIGFGWRYRQKGK